MLGLFTAERSYHDPKMAAKALGRLEDCRWSRFWLALMKAFSVGVA